MKALSGLAVGLVAFVMLAGCASRRDAMWAPSPPQARLVEYTAQRLELAREVAWFKYREGQPVKDRRREKERLGVLVADGRRLGVPTGRTRGYFKAQMRASRAYQQILISGWQRGGALPTQPSRDLKKVLRPQIERLDAGILAQLAATGDSSRDARLARRAETYLKAREIPQRVIRTAIAPLR